MNGYVNITRVCKAGRWIVGLLLVLALTVQAALPGSRPTRLCPCRPSPRRMRAATVTCSRRNRRSAVPLTGRRRSGFSVYALVSISARDGIVHDVSGFDDEPVYLSATSSTGKVYYFKGTTAANGSNTLIAKTAANDTAGAAAYSFEKAEGTDNHFYMSLAGEGGNVKYLKFVTNEQVQFKEPKSEATPLTIAPCGGISRISFSFLLFRTTRLIT